MDDATQFASTSCRECDVDKASGSVVTWRYGDMDARLWGNLPEDVVDRVLAWLPVSSFLRFQTVCKRWGSLMRSNSFLDVCAHIPSPGPYFFILSKRASWVFPVYNPASDKWHGIPVKPPLRPSVPVAAAGGLLCYVAGFDGHKTVGCMNGYDTLLVCNPITNSWRELPPMICRRKPTLVGMLVDKDARSYQVVVTGDYSSHGNRFSTEVYDSNTRAWRVGGPVPAGEEASHNVAVCQGHVYCLARGSKSLLSYSVEKDEWTKVATSRMPGFPDSRNLLEWRGEIVLVGKGVMRQMLSVYIWLLEQPTMKWREVGRLPQTISDLFPKTRSECFYCSGHGDLLFFYRHNNGQGLLYDLARKSWKWVARYPSSGPCGILASMFALSCFEPRLDCSV